MRRRSGFTLTELLVVIAILLLLSTLAFAVFGTGKSSDKMRSGARTAQSAFLGAKDRALHAKDLRGVRLARDQTNFNLVNGFVYIQSLGVLTYPQGSFQMERLDVNPPDGNPDSADVLILRGFDGTENGPPLIPYVDWVQKQQFFLSPGRIRIPSGTGGQWYSFFVNTSGPYALQQGNECLQLATSYPQGPTNPYPGSLIAYPRIPVAATGSCDIQLGNDVLPFHQPITLPSGCLIDLTQSQMPTPWYQQQSVPPSSVPAGWTVCGPDFTLSGNVIVRLMNVTAMDVLFSARGNITGTIAAMGNMFFMLRDIRDATYGIYPGQVGPVNGTRAPIPQTPGDYPDSGRVSPDRSRSDLRTRSDR